MSQRMQILEDCLQQLTKYTQMDPYRPGLVDLYTYEFLMQMHESDYDGQPMYLWKKTPDVIMQHIIDNDASFSLEYGYEDLDEQLRDYLFKEGFIVDADSVSDEEYTNNLEGRL